jgi:hypothetical protein
MIPEHDKQGDLLAGIWDATWTEIEAHFATNVKRRELFAKFKQAVLALRAAGCRELFLGGSFVTTKLWPEDIDATWNVADVRIDELKANHPEFFALAPPRAELHRLYGADIGMADWVCQPYPRILFFEWLQKKRWSNKKKGILRIDLEVDDDWYRS